MKLHGSPALMLCLSLVMAAPAVLRGTSGLSASPDNVVFQYTPGQQLPPPVFVQISASDKTSPVITAGVTAATGTPAALFPQPPVNGDTLQVVYDINTLNSLQNQPGVYRATITVNAPGFQALEIPVTLSISTSLSINALPASLTFVSPGQTAQSITLTGSGAPNVTFTMSFSTSSGGNWLAVTASADYTPATLTVTINPLILPVGNFGGSIVIADSSTGQQLTIPVTVQVGTNSFAASPAALSFAYTQGSTIPPPQVVQLSSPVQNDTFTAQASSTQNWLLVNGVTANVSGPLPATLNITVNPSGLALGTYQGAVQATDANNNTQTVAVTLVVSGVSGVANPTSLVFVGQAGGAPPAPQTVSIQGFGAASFTASVNGAWLSVSSLGGTAPTQINVSANPAGLAAGTYTGTVVIDLDTHVQTIQASFVVSASPVLTANPGDLILAYQGGSLVPGAMSVNVGVSSGSPQGFSFATGLPAWLQVGPSGPLASPQTLTVTITPQSLPTGDYVGQVILTPSGSGPALVVPVVLDVTNAPQVTPSVTSLSLNATAGASPVSQSVGVTAPTPLSFTATAATSTGGAWLSVSPGSAVTGNGSLPLTIIADPSNLAAGTYSGEVTLTTAGGVVTQIAVTFTVSASNVPFTVSPLSLAFEYTVGGAAPPAQTVQITGSQSFTASPGTSAGGAWLAVSPTSGAGTSSLSVSVSTAGLAAGAYNGSITVTPAGGAPQTVAVSLTVTSAVVLSATPNPLAFTYIAGNPSPAAQSVSVTSSGGAMAFTAAASSTGWLSVAPASATTPAAVSVSVNPANLGAGAYQGSVTLTAAGGATFIVNVTLTVTAPLPTIDRLVNAASYSGGGIAPGEIAVLFGSAMGPSTGVSAAIDSKGYIETNLANVQVTFNGYAAPVLYASAGQINVIVPYELAGSSDALVEVVFGKARSNTISLPVVSSAPGVFSADQSGTGGAAVLDVNYRLVSPSNPVSPGAVIQIFATGQGQTQPGGVDGLIEPLTLPLPYPLLSPGVTIGGLAANITYAGAAPGLVAGALQVNAVVPPGVASGAAELIVSIGGVSSQNGITVAVQ